MYWVMGGVILVGMGILLRRALGLGTPVSHRAPFLDAGHKWFCASMAEEVQSRSKMIAALLNDAIDELQAGHCRNAADLLGLVEAGWTGRAELLVELLRAITDYLPLARIVIPIRSPVPAQCRSDVMIDYLRVHTLLDQFLFRSKLRFHLQIRILRHAVDILTADFRRADPKNHLSPTFSRALWDRLDRDDHDFDLVAKKTVLALAKFISWLPQDAASKLVQELRPLLDRGVRSVAHPVCNSLGL